MIIGRLKKGNPMRKENRFRIFDLFAPGRTQDPADSRLDYETETHVCVYDYLENRRICAVPLPHSEKFSRRELRVSPDGKTLYVKGEEGWHVLKM